jgi:hypothetical protein
LIVRYSELILIVSLRSFRNLELTSFASLRYRNILYLTGSFCFDFAKIPIIEASLCFVSISLTLLLSTCPICAMLHMPTSCTPILFTLTQRTVHVCATPSTRINKLSLQLEKWFIFSTENNEILQVYFMIQLL